MSEPAAQTKAMQLAYLDLLIAINAGDDDQHRAVSRTIVDLDQSEDAGTFHRALTVIMPLLSEGAAVGIILGLINCSPSCIAEARNGLL